MKTLTKEQVFQHMADNVRNGKSATCGLMMCETGGWIPLGEWCPVAEIRASKIALAPRTHTLNGYEVPAPETQAPVNGAEYCVLDVFERDGVYQHNWSGDNYDLLALCHGLWLSKKDAIANAKALRGENPYE